MSVADTTAGTTYGTDETRTTLDETFEMDNEFEAGCVPTEFFCYTVSPCF
jgi:hypothetical protein